MGGAGPYSDDDDDDPEPERGRAVAIRSLQTHRGCGGALASVCTYVAFVPTRVTTATMLARGTAHARARAVHVPLRTLAKAHVRPNSPEARMAEQVVSEVPQPILAGYAPKMVDKVSVEAMQTRNLALIEDEFRQEIAQALGKTEAKLVGLLKDVRVAEVHFEAAMALGSRQVKEARLEELNDAIGKAGESGNLSATRCWRAG